MGDRQWLFRRPSGDITKPVSLGVILGVAKSRLDVEDQPFHIKIDDEKMGTKRTRTGALTRFKNVVVNGDVGQTVRVYTDTPFEPILWVRESKPDFKVLDTNGNQLADVAWSVAKANFQNINYLGAYVCKTIIGSGGSYSQHSYGNALDIGAGSMTTLKTIAKFFVAHASEYDLQHVIVDDEIWTRGSGWSYYGGQRHYHVHLDFNPQYSGGCGVRGPN